MSSACTAMAVLGLLSSCRKSVWNVFHVSLMYFLFLVLDASTAAAVRTWCTIIGYVMHLFDMTAAVQ